MSFESNFNLLPFILLLGAIIGLYSFLSARKAGTLSPTWQLGGFVFVAGFFGATLVFPFKEYFSFDNPTRTIVAKRLYVSRWIDFDNLSLNQINSFDLECKSNVRGESCQYKSIVFDMKDNTIYTLNYNKFEDIESIKPILEQNIKQAPQSCREQFLNRCVRR